MCSTPSHTSSNEILPQAPAPLDERRQLSRLRIEHERRHRAKATAATLPLSPAPFHSERQHARRFRDDRVPSRRSLPSPMSGTRHVSRGHREETSATAALAGSQSAAPEVEPGRGVCRARSEPHCGALPSTRAVNSRRSPPDMVSKSGGPARPRRPVRAIALARLPVRPLEAVTGRVQLQFEIARSCLMSSPSTFTPR